jgi:hypothetical protein
LLNDLRAEGSYRASLITHEAPAGEPFSFTIARDAWLRVLPVLAGYARLIAHRCALADAEEYGDCLTCPHGHYDLWEGWRIGSAPDGLTNIVRDAEYEEWPRGRVVFNFVQRRFIVYGDRQVFKYELQNLVVEHFGIPAEGNVEFAKDGHYQSTRSLRPGPERSRPPSSAQII